MSREIEAKIKVAAFEPIIEMLQQLGAEFLHAIDQLDMYYADDAGRLSENGCALRIRKQLINGGHSSLITFKGPKTAGKFKDRAEYETTIDHPETVEKIFEALGCRKQIEVEKKRTMWSVDGCEICLDKLPQLGCFIEVEGPDESTITGVLKKLGLDQEPHITASYASMKAENESRKKI